jgi:hypothetical protein
MARYSQSRCKPVLPLTSSPSGSNKSLSVFVKAHCVPARQSCGLFGTSATDKLLYLESEFVLTAFGPTGAFQQDMTFGNFPRSLCVFAEAYGVASKEKYNDICG